MKVRGGWTPTMELRVGPTGIMAWLKDLGAYAAVARSKMIGSAPSHQTDGRIDIGRDTVPKASQSAPVSSILATS